MPSLQKPPRIVELTAADLETAKQVVDRGAASVAAFPEGAFCLYGGGPERNIRHRKLTKEEVDALNSLAIARTDLIKISNVLSKKTAEEKARFFKNEKFMRWWIDAVAGLIQHWYSIEENIATNVQTKSKEDT